MASSSRFNEGEELLAIHLAELGVEFERQYPYVPGRKFRADFAIPSINLLIEINGGQLLAIGGHSGPIGIQRDNERLNHAALAGYRVMRFTPKEVKSGAAKEVLRQSIGEKA